MARLPRAALAISPEPVGRSSRRECLGRRRCARFEGRAPQGRQAPQSDRARVARCGLSRARRGQPAPLHAQGDAEHPRPGRIEMKLSAPPATACSGVPAAGARRLRLSVAARRARCCRPTARGRLSARPGARQRSCSRSTIWASRGWSAGSTGSMRPWISTPQQPEAARLVVVIEVASIDLESAGLRGGAARARLARCRTLSRGALREPARSRSPGRTRARSRAS